MDLGRWLRDRKKQLEGIEAQVNPFDGGKTYSSVTRRPTVDPFKSNNVNAKYGVLADKGRRDQFIQNNQRESFSTPIATFQSLQDIPGKIGNALINNPIADKAADITGTNRQTSVEGRNSSNYLKPTGVIDNTVAAVSNLGQFNPIRSAGDVGQYLDTVSEKSRFKPVGDIIGDQTKDAANFGKPIEGSEWDARNLKNPVARNAGEFSTMLGQTANFAVPVAGPLAIGGMVANEANELVNTARARGEDETIANLKGLLSGAGQAAVERFSSKLTTALPGSSKVAGMVTNKLAKIPVSLAGGAITEGGEEFVQGLMSNAARGNDLTEGLKEQTIQGAKGGLLLGGFFGGANYAANRSQGATQEAAQQVEQQNPKLQQTGIPAQPGSIRERIQQAKENVKSTIVNSQLAQNEDGYIQLPNGRREVVTNKPSTFEDFAPQVQAGNITDNVEIVPRNTLQKGPGTDGTNVDQARIKEYQQMIREDVPIAPMITDPTGKLINDGQNRLAALAREGITDVPITKETIKKPLSGAAQQSQLSKQSQLNDTELTVKNYFENNAEKIGDSTTGEGAKIPVQLDKNKKQSLLEKTRAAARLITKDEGGGYDGGRSAQERVDAKKPDSPLTDQAYAETFGVSLDKAKKDLSKPQKRAEPLSSVGMTEEQANKKLESRAVSMSPTNKKTKTLVNSMINDKKLTEAARIAQSEGKELNYFAKKDNNGRSVGIEEYNPSRQRIEAGFVVDNTTGKVLGNHIKVDATGTQINIGGEVVNISDVVGNPLDWKGDYEVSSTMERNIFKNAPNKEIAQKTYKFVVANKIQAEANLRKDIESQRKSLNANVKEVLKAKPRSVSRKDFGADIFDFIENKKSQADIAKTYGPKTTQAIIKYKSQTRELYDNLLDRANTELAKFGEKTIPKRSDYITHINELNQTPSFAGELMGQLQNSMLGEGYTTTRGSVPGDIAGRTETFSPRKRWNPFAQQRKGGEYTKDPFKAVDSYLEPTLYNIHMTESAVRARAVESAFRTAEILKNTEASKVSTDLDKELEKYKKQSNNGKLVAGFQEYANALAGKTQRWDRQIIDASKGTATALKGWQGLQRIGGRATILGNINSVLMQPLNQASVIAEVKLPNYIKGVASSLAGNNVENKSPFIRARAAKIESAFRSRGQKAMDKAGVPLQFVELASVKLAWNAEYQQVLSEGFKGQDAIIEADRRTEKAVAGRGIADKPELYRSTLTNGLLQYTLEVNAQNKKFWRDLTPVQKGKFMVAAFGMNTIMEAVTGNEPLPDFIGATIDTFRDFMNDDDDTPLENAGKGVQRFASEAVSMNPMLSAGANLLPDGTKKTLFGSDSDLTRFEGVPAPIGVIQNAVDVGKNVANGDVKKARDSALKLVPGGNQIRKTLQGKELIQDGAKTGKDGKVQYEAPEGPLGKAQALLFGPSATKNAREYYDSMSAKLSGATDKLSSLKKDSSGKTIDDFKTIAQSAFNTDKGKEFMALTNDDERKEFARQSSENRGIYEQYKSMQKAFNGGDDLLPEGLSKESEAILNKYDRMEAKTREDIFYRENDAEYKYELAKYEKDKLEGTISEVDAIRKEKSLAKQAIGSKYEKGIRDVYSLSKEQIEDLVTGDPAGKAIYDKLVKYDKELYDAGLISYLKFKNGLASGRSGGGRGKKDTSLTDSFALQGQTLSRLQKLLAGTTFAGAETVTTPKTQKAKQKKITVNMKA